jgi:hypothetical protein
MHACEAVPMLLSIRSVLSTGRKMLSTVYCWFQVLGMVPGERSGNSTINISFLFPLLNPRQIVENYYKTSPLTAHHTSHTVHLTSSPHYTQQAILSAPLTQHSSNPLRSRISTICSTSSLQLFVLPPAFMGYYSKPNLEIA